MGQYEKRKKYKNKEVGYEFFSASNLKENHFGKLPNELLHKIFMYKIHFETNEKRKISKQAWLHKIEEKRKRRERKLAADKQPSVQYKLQALENKRRLNLQEKQEYIERLKKTIPYEDNRMRRELLKMIVNLEREYFENLNSQ